MERDLSIIPFCIFIHFLILCVVCVRVCVYLFPCCVVAFVVACVDVHLLRLVYWFLPVSEM